MNGSPPELALLAALLRGEADQQSGLEGWDDEQLWQAAGHHGVRGLLHHLQGEQLDSRPALQQRLQQHYRQSAAAEIMREQALADLLERFEAAGLEPLILKGTALAVSLYPHPHLRQRCDVDMLFARRADAEACWELLESLGYQRSLNVNGHYVQSQYTASSRQLVLDVHWRISNQYHLSAMFPLTELLEERQQCSDGALSFHGLGWRHALQFALIHRAGHLHENEPERLIWLYDLYLLCPQLGTDDWQRLLDWAAQHQVASLLLDGLQAARHWLHAEPPDEVLHQLSDLERQQPEPLWLRSSLRMQLANYRALPGWLARLQMLEDHFLPDAYYMRRKYGVQHPLLLAGCYVHRAVTGLFGALGSRAGAGHSH